MNWTAKTKDMLKAAALLAKVTGKPDDVLEVFDAGLCARGSGLSLRWSPHPMDTTSDGPPSVAVPHATLRRALESLRLAGVAEVAVSLDGPRLKLSGLEDSASAAIGSTPGEKWPRLDDPALLAHCVAVPQRWFAEALAGSARILSSPVGLGKFDALEIESGAGKFSIASTDSARIAVFSYDLQSLGDPDSFQAHVLGAHLVALRAAMDKSNTSLTMAITADAVRLVWFNSCGHWQARVSTTTRAFPQWRKVLPSSFTGPISLAGEAAELACMVRAAEAVAKGDRLRTILEVGQDPQGFPTAQLLVDSEGERLQASFPLAFESGGQPGRLRFNARLLRELLAMTQGHVLLDGKDEKTPFRIHNTATGFLGLIMPMTL